MHIEEQLEDVNLAIITLKHSSKYRNQRQELVNCNNFPPCINLLHQKILALKVIMNCRTARAGEFRTTLGFNQCDLILTKEYSLLSKIMK